MSAQVARQLVCLGDSLATKLDQVITAITGNAPIDYTALFNQVISELQSIDTNTDALESTLDSIKTDTTAITTNTQNTVNELQNVVTELQGIDENTDDVETTLAAILAALLAPDDEPSQAIQLPDLCATVDGGAAENVTPVVLFNQMTGAFTGKKWLNQAGDEITGAVVEADPCDCPCVDCTPNEAPVVAPGQEIPNQSSVVNENITPLDAGSKFSDPEGDTMTFSATGLPANLSINPTTGVISGQIGPFSQFGSPYNVVVTADDGNGNTTDCPFTWTVQLAADLSVGKSVDNATPNEGDTITYTIVADAQSTDGAGNVFVADVLPAGLTFVSFSGAGSYDPASGWTIGTMGAASVSLGQIVATVDAGTAGNTITNTAVISADDFDPDTSNNTASVDIVPQAPPALNLAFSKVGVAVAGAQNNGTFAPTGLGSQARPVNTADSNGVYASPNWVLQDLDFSDPFVNPAAGPGSINVTNLLWDLNLPAGVTTFSMTLSETSPDNAAGYGVAIFDSASNQVLVEDGGSAGYSVGNNGTRNVSYVIPAGVQSQNLRMINFTLGNTFNTTLTDGVGITNAAYVTQASDASVDFTMSVQNNGAAPAAGITVTDSTLGLSGAAVTPDPIPVGGVGTVQGSYQVQASDLAAGVVQNQATIDQTSQTAFYQTNLNPGGTQQFQGNPTVYRSRDAIAGDYANVFDTASPTALPMANFVAPGFLSNLGLPTPPGNQARDTIIELDMPVDTDTISVDISITSSSQSGAFWGFVDLTTGLPVTMSSHAASGSLSANAFDNGGSFVQGDSGTVTATVPFGFDVRNLGLAIMEVGATSGAPNHDIISVGNFNFS